jgi:hypothetical protein
MIPLPVPPSQFRHFPRVSAPPIDLFPPGVPISSLRITGVKFVFPGVPGGKVGDPRWNGSPEVGRRGRKEPSPEKI